MAMSYRKFILRKFNFDLMRFKTITNTTHETLITGTSAADSILNYGYHVTISTGNGDDTVENIWDEDYNEDNDFSSAEYVSINTGEGNDFVYNNFSYACTINTGAGNDSVSNDCAQHVTINTGAGNDFAYNNDWDCTINTDAGNDLVSLGANADNNLIIYKNGDGNDKIYGFNGDDTLSISGGSYSTTKSGSNVIVTVDDGKISLIGAADYISDSNIVFTKTVKTNKWTISGTTAKYGTASKTLLKVSGVKSLSGLKISNKTVTVSAAVMSLTLRRAITRRLRLREVQIPTLSRATARISQSTAARVTTR